MSEINEYLKDLPASTPEEKRWKNLCSNCDGHYFVSAYEKGDDYSAPFFLCSNLQEAVITIERNDGDWIDCIYNYAIVWKINSSSFLPANTAEILGIYRIEESDNLNEEQGWIDFEVVEVEENRFCLIFDGISLDINEETGPHAFRYKKNRLLKGYYL